MTYNIDTLFEDWKTFCLETSPSCPIDSLTMDYFITCQISEFETLMNEGGDIPDELIFIIDHISKDS